MTQDGGGPVRTKCFPAAGWNLAAAAKSCDCCKSSPALLFCRTDSTFMCMACDAKVHAGAADHERVWMCEVCEQAPASVTCKADAASLCFACDRDIHSANPLSRRHHRVPVVPFFDTAESMVMKTAAAALLVPADDIFAAPPCQKNIDSSVADESGYITDNSWISSNPIVADKFPVETADIKSVELLFSDSDQFLDFDNYQICSQPYSDSVVPVQTTVKPPVQAQSTGHQHMPENRFEIDFTRSNITSYTNSYTTPRSLSHSVSSLSLDVGVVPDGSAALSEISYPFSATISSSIDLSANLGNSQVVGMDREARVLRYREKRKNRKFEKTIRYASRKAYAETRPRIKGRFAKRTDSAESDTDGLFFSGAGSPVVPADESSRYYSNSNYPILLNYICNN